MFFFLCLQGGTGERASDRGMMSKPTTTASPKQILYNDAEKAAIRKVLRKLDDCSKVRKGQ